MIHEIRIQNFESIRDMTVEFTQVRVLLGRSGTGKSIFVKAVRFLRDLLGGLRTLPSQCVRTIAIEFGPTQSTLFSSINLHNHAVLNHD